jgi:hypothetical protein
LIKNFQSYSYRGDLILRLNWLSVVRTCPISKSSLWSLCSALYNVIRKPEFKFIFGCAQILDVWLLDK